MRVSDEFKRLTSEQAKEWSRLTQRPVSEVMVTRALAQAFTKQQQGKVVNVNLVVPPSGQPGGRRLNPWWGF